VARRQNQRKRNETGRVLSQQTPAHNEECYRPKFFNCRGTSNIDLTITNNSLLAKVSEWEIINEDSLSDHNYIQYTIREGGAKTQNINYTNGTRFKIKEGKLHIFDQNLVKEMWKTVHNEQIEGQTEELDKYLSTGTTDNNLEQQIELISEAIKSACYGTFRNTTTRKKKSKKTVPWWTDNLTIMRKRVNAYRRLPKNETRLEIEGRQKEKLRGGKEKVSNRNKKGETKLMKRILQRDSLHKPVVTSLQTGSRENTNEKYNYPNKTR